MISLYVTQLNTVESYHSSFFKITSTTKCDHAKEETSYSRDMLPVLKIAVKFVMKVPNAFLLSGGELIMPIHQKGQTTARLHPHVPINIRKKERVIQ